MSSVAEHQAEQDAITTAQAQDYLDRRGEDCPACNSPNTQGGSYDLLTGTLYQSMHCADCGIDWEDAYELNRILFVDAEWTGGVG